MSTESNHNYCKSNIGNVQPWYDPGAYAIVK